MGFIRRDNVFPAAEDVGAMEVGVHNAAVAAGRLSKRGSGGGGIRQLSNESEHDLAVLVSDFLENGSGGGESWCSSDGDSGFSDLLHLTDNISLFKRSMDQYESNLLSIVQSILISMGNPDLQSVNCGLCNGSCIRFSLVKLIRSAGYDAAVCSSKWQGCNKVLGGDHEYIDVMHYNDDGTSNRFIIDIDFRSHFEIARAVDSYNKILKSLPVVFVGSLTKLKQFLQVMAEAARVSLKQNSMPLPPWRSLAYLQAKWHSPYQRNVAPEKQNVEIRRVETLKQCIGHLRRLQSSLQLEIEVERLLKPINSDARRRMKLERIKSCCFRTL